MGIKESPRLNTGALLIERPRENIQVFSAHERFSQGLDTNCQTNWVFNGTEFVRQSENSHRIGKGITRERAVELLNKRDLIVFEEVIDPVFCFECKQREAKGKFLTISWYSWVGKKGERSIEQLTFFLYGMTKEQAEQIPQELLAHQEFEPSLFGEDEVSIKENIDLLIADDDWFLKTFETILTDQQKTERKNTTLLEQTKGLEEKRELVHSGKFKEFETHPKIIWVEVNGRKEARYADFDHVKQCWVWRRETTNDSEVLAGIIKEEEIITNGWKPGMNMVLRSCIGLSSRTAGKLQPENIIDPPVDLDAIKNSFIDENGNVREVSNFVPRTPANEIYNQKPVDVTPEYYPAGPDLLPTIPPFYPIDPRPIMPGGGSFPVLPVTSRLNYERSNPVPEVNTGIFVAGLLAPATFGYLGEFVAPAVTAGFVFQPDKSQVVTESANTISFEESNTVTEENVDVSLSGAEPNTDNVDEYFSEKPYGELFFGDSTPPFIPEAPDGGGGLVLPQEIQATVWDSIMEERFKQAEKPVAYEDKSLGSEAIPPLRWNTRNTPEQVVFDFEKEIKFKQYASDLEVIEVAQAAQAEKVEQVGEVEKEEQEGLTTFLLANYQQEFTQDKPAPDVTCDKNLFIPSEVAGHVHEFVTDKTAQQRSKEQVSVVKLPEKTPKKEPTIRKNHHKNMQPYNFVTEFSFNNLLLSYLKQRQVLGELLKQNTSLPKPANNNGENVAEKTKQQIEQKTANKSFLQKLEQQKTKAKKTKVKNKTTNPAFLSLLLLTKIKLLMKVKLLAGKNNFAGFKQLFMTDALLLFILNPKLFLVNKSVILPKPE